LGDKLGDTAAVKEKQPHQITPAGGFYYLHAENRWMQLVQPSQVAAINMLLDLYVKIGQQTPYVVNSIIRMPKQSDPFSVDIQTVSITQKDWSKP
jgi:hypothetical protein